MIPIQGFWAGGDLSAMERLSIKSFLANGHAYHLYGFDRPRNLPARVEYLNARDILPRVNPADFQELATYADYFRYALLWRCGGWWADTDVVCLRPFVSDSYVFASEASAGPNIATDAVMRAPIGSPIMEFLVNVCASKSPGAVQWGEIGPRLLDEAVRGFSLMSYVAHPDVFCKIPYWEWQRFLDDGEQLPVAAGVHLWSAMWRQDGRSKDAQYSAGCLYEQLKRRFGI